YESMSAIQCFLGAKQNYPFISGAINLYKCFIPQAWTYSGPSGISAFIHPNGVFDDPRGGTLREEIYPRLRKHFQFINELKLFAEVDHHMGFSLNVYSNRPSRDFDMIANVFDVSTVDQCYENTGNSSV